MTRVRRALLPAILAASIAAPGVLGCSGRSTVNEDENNGIYGAWVSTSADGQSGVRLTLTIAQTYTLEELTMTSPTSAEARAESGTFTATGGTLTWSPEMSSCRGAEASYQSAYQLASASLSLALPSDVVVLSADDTDGDDDASSTTSFTTGCFAADGTFTAEPLAAVAN